jgi:malate dehydrogenase
MKVTIVGAGVGLLAQMLFLRGIASSSIGDMEGFAEGKALDIIQCTNTFNYKVVGVTNDYSRTANSNVVVIT